MDWVDRTAGQHPSKERDDGTPYIGRRGRRACRVEWPVQDRYVGRRCSVLDVDGPLRRRPLFPLGGPMRARFLVAFAALMLLRAIPAAASTKCWQLAGDELSCYQLDRDFVVTYAGKPSGRLMSVGECQS